MKTTIKCIAATMLLMIAVSAHAQQTTKRGPEERSKMEVRGLQKHLSLTDAQADQCEQIIKKYATQLSDAKQAKSDSTRQGNTKQQLIKKRNAEIKALLTPEQQSKFENWKQKKQQHRGKAMVRDSVPVK
jgi:Spy/CpxP family protein refolding chaperone